MKALIKRHRLLIAVVISLVFLFILLFILSRFIAVSLNLFDAQGTISVSLDKYDMDRIDKMEIETPLGVTLIEDKSIIKEVTKTTMTTKYIYIKTIYGHYYIRLYRNGKLIRDMDLSTYNNIIKVNNSDSLHYFPDFAAYDEESGGQVIITDELIKKLNLLLLEQGNRFGDASGGYD